MQSHVDRVDYMLIRRVLGCVLAACLAVSQVVSGVAVAQQVEDKENPIIIHRQAETPGVAGELQTFLVRAYDDVEVVGVTLYYRQSDSAEYESIPMRPLLDSLGEYMIAVETEISEYPGLQYYIEAVDASGNLTSRGFSYAPIILALDAPETPPAAVAPQTQPTLTERADEGSPFSVSTILLGVGALLLLGALAGGSGGGSEGSGGETVTLTIVSDAPTGN